MDYSLFTLKNGLRVVLVPMSSVESVTVMVGVGAGSRYETRQINGISHFLEHMAFKGTKKRPTTKEIASEIEGVGGIFNAYTDKEFTGYWVKLPAKYLPLALDILSDMLTNSLFKEEEIEREKGVIIEEINMREDVPMTKVAVEFERLFYGDNSMGWDIAGEKETVVALKRDDFLTYLRQLYFAQNMVLVIAGQKEELKKTNKLIKLIEDYFGQLPKVGKKISKNINYAFLNQKKAKQKIIRKKTEQAHFCLGVPAPSLKDQFRWSTAVLSAILGGGMSSRLFLEIREKRGLAYYITTEYEPNTDSGYLVCRAGVCLDKVNQAIKLVKEEMEKLATKKVEDKELTKAKEMLKGHLILRLEDSQAMADRYAGQLILEGKIRTLAQALEEIDKVGKEEVLKTTRQLFKREKINLTVILP
ncbi:MAG: M16 family metallopeptidase [Microgenomates group bacterium]